MRKLLVPVVLLCAALAGAATQVIQDQCGPFTDVSPAICPYVLEMYYLGITAGTSPTTYSPDATVTRGQAAVFVSKGINQAITRSSRRAALGHWWTPQNSDALAITDVDWYPQFPASDGADIWVPNTFGYVSRVRASDGRILETWTNAPGASQTLVAMGRVFVTGTNLPGGHLFMIDPSQPATDVTAIAQDLDGPLWLAFDGSRIWVTSPYAGKIWIFTPPSWSMTTVTGFQSPENIVFDGQNMWVTELGANALYRLDSNGAIVQTVSFDQPYALVFDGENLWCTSGVDHLVVVRASTGTIVADLTGNGMTGLNSLAFDGKRILATNSSQPAGSVSLWDAASLAPLGNVPLNGIPQGVCSDGLNFWITLNNDGILLRF